MPFHNIKTRMPISPFVRKVSKMGQAQSDEPDLSAPAPTDRPLPEDPLDPSLLSRYKCPAQDCTDKWCSFGGHVTDPEAPNLRTLPKCFCVERLLGSCESTNLERLNPGDLVKCEGGFHPEAQDLLEPERFVRLVASAIQGRRAQAVKEPDCVICLKPLPTLGSPTNGCYLSGYLENCIHRFCGKCIQKWRTGRQNHPSNLQFTCPTCRAPSCRIMFWPDPLVRPLTRARLFAQQKAHFGLHVGPNTMVSITDPPREEDGAHFMLGLDTTIYRYRSVAL